MKFYEVHDQDGCLIKTRNLRVAKRSALAFLSMKSSRLVHIQVHARGVTEPAARISLDRATLSWSDARTPSPAAGYSHLPEISGETGMDFVVTG